MLHDPGRSRPDLLRAIAARVDKSQSYFWHIAAIVTAALRYGISVQEARKTDKMPTSRP
jgi:hypothetical protein